MKTCLTHGWILGYALVLGLWAYYCSRGADGRLLEALVGLAVLGVTYWLIVWFVKKRSASSHVAVVLVHLVVVEAAVILALMADPQLQEMGGILNLLWPVGMLAIICIGWFVSWMADYCQRPGQPEI